MCFFRRNKIEITAVDGYDPKYQPDLDLIVSQYRSKKELERTFHHYNILFEPKYEGSNARIVAGILMRQCGLVVDGPLEWEEIDQINGPGSMEHVESTLRLNGLERYFRHRLELREDGIYRALRYREIVNLNEESLKLAEIRRV